LRGIHASPLKINKYTNAEHMFNTLGPHLVTPPTTCVAIFRNLFYCIESRSTLSHHCRTRSKGHQTFQGSLRKFVQTHKYCRTFWTAQTIFYLIPQVLRLVPPCRSLHSKQQ
jgi:hypothetical protein